MKGYTELRDYQAEMLSRLQQAWRRARSVLVQMPTGTGKTHLLAAEIKRFSPTLFSEKDGGKLSRGVLIVAHRRELIEQIKETLAAFGIRTDGENCTVRVESIQKLSHGLTRTNAENGHGRGRTGTDGKENTPFSPELVVVDEAHHALAKTYKMLWEWWPKAKFLGLTATPCRLSGEAFTGLFDVLLQSWTIQEFIDQGWLSDFEYVSASPESMMYRQVVSLSKRGADGDYQTKETAMVLDCEESIEHLYKTYRQFARGKKGIVYAIDRQHAQHIAKYYKANGVSCAVIDAKTPAEERKRLIDEYKSQPHTVLINVDIFSEGFDCPEVEFIQLARPTLSLSKYLQQVGRGMRISKGKEAVLILDQVGAYQTFGLPTDERDWEMTFRGRLAGKGNQANVRGIVIRDDLNDRELMNLEMVRIKRRGETRKGVEIFVKEGKYGIMKDGRVTCAAEFEKISRTQAPYFAMGVYPYYVFKNRTTLIDMEGRDLRLKMYGSLEWEGEVLKGQDINDSALYWDSKYNAYYHEKPEFEALAGVEMVRLKDGYVLRQLPNLSKPARKADIYYNERLIWMNDWLLLKQKEGDDSYHCSPFKILAYGFRCFYVKSKSTGGPPVTIIYREGGIGDRKWGVPIDDDAKLPPWRDIPLTNASTGKKELSRRTLP